jgi:hypothetical protein
MDHNLFLIDNETVYLDGEILPLEESLAVRAHSPTGFSWGYLGSGCAQLALAILLKTNHTEATMAYQRFKQEVIARIPDGGRRFAEFSIEKDRDGALRFSLIKVSEISVIGILCEHCGKVIEADPAYYIITAVHRPARRGNPALHLGRYWYAENRPAPSALYCTPACAAKAASRFMKANIN